MACNDKNAFFTSEQPKRYKLWSSQKMCDALHYLLDNIFIRFGSKLYILKPSSNRSPYIFTLVEKVKHWVYKIDVFK